MYFSIFFSIRKKLRERNKLFRYFLFPGLCGEDCFFLFFLAEGERRGIPYLNRKREEMPNSFLEVFG